MATKTSIWAIVGVDGHGPLEAPYVDPASGEKAVVKVPGNLDPDEPAEWIDWALHHPLTVAGKVQGADRLTVIGIQTATRSKLNGLGAARVISHYEGIEIADVDMSEAIALAGKQKAEVK